MDLVLRPAAAADVEDAFAWYQRQRAGLGDEFLEAVKSGLSEVRDYPFRQAVVFGDMRRLLLKRFPYAIYYRVYPNVIVVVACMHGRRDPLRWQQRT